MHGMDVLFDRWPALLGFSVQAAEELTDDRDWMWLDQGLAVADIALKERISPKQELEIMAGVAAALRELIEEMPRAEDLLRGRTFARTLH